MGRQVLRNQLRKRAARSALVNLLIEKSFIKEEQYEKQIKEGCKGQIKQFINRTKSLGLCLCSQS